MSALRTIESALTDIADLSWQQPTPGEFLITLPGTRKLACECALIVGQHYLHARAFVARKPEENPAGVYRWLLQHNLKLTLVAFSVDHLGDIYLTGRIPLSSVTGELVDQLLGVIADASDSSFNKILKLGFASSIQAEWAWRRARGLSTKNLQKLYPGS